ncbi:MAG: hypothetical protein E6R04_06435 [Spirochaetes bacterium]|nr:MAG: hypothetical protein E6R04_06435 [Spirochaetota bacterium]
MTQEIADKINELLGGIETEEEAVSVQDELYDMARGFKDLIRTFESTIPDKTGIVHEAIGSELNQILSRLYSGIEDAKDIAESIRQADDDERVYGRYEDQVRSTYRDGLL